MGRTKKLLLAFALALATVSPATAQTITGAGGNGTVTSVTCYGSAITTTGTCTTTGATPGVATNTAASAGKVGQVLTANASAVSLSTGNAATVTSVPLTAGDWDVSCQFVFTGGASTTVTRILGSISTVNNTLNSTIGQRGDVVPNGATVYANGNPSINVGPIQALLSGTTTYYCVAQSEFGTSTTTVSAIIFARRRN